MTHFHAQRGRRLLPFIVLFMAAVTFTNAAHATGMDTTVGSYYYVLTAQSEMDINIHAQIFDDWEHGGWNCNRAFLFTTYTDDDVQLEVGVSSLAPYTACSCNDIYIWRYYDGFPSTPTYASYPYDSTFDMHPSTQGLYIIEVFNHGDNPAIVTPLLTGYIISIPRIKNMWIEAQPVCYGDLTNGAYYHFQVKTEPPISSFLQMPGNLGGGSPPGCEPAANPYSIQLNFGAYPCNDTTAEGQLIVTDTGAMYSVYDDNSFFLTNDSGIDETNYYISDSQLLAAISPTTGCYGVAPVIKVFYTDGVQYTTGGISYAPTPITATAPIIIQYPAIPASSYPGNPTGTPAGPPHATGIPFPSYDIYNYKVSGSETWTPYYNPIVTMHGGGTVNIIRIQDSLTIPPGTHLTIESGMHIEMGPGGKIIVQNNTDTTGFGGSLSLGSSTLTAYRGCGDAAGTDLSTWAGLTVAGLSSGGQGASDFPYFVSPQGQLNMSHDTISYADVGLQNGFSATAAGGIFRDFGGSDAAFYNNKQAVLIWPYHNVISGVEYNNINDLIGEHFINDSSGWFPVTSVIKATEIQNIGTEQCSFLNNTGAVIPYGILGFHAGIGSGGIATFTNYTYAIMGVSTTGSESIKISQTTFNNDHFGLALYGSTAPNIFHNTFNLPDYTGYSPTVFPGTSAMVATYQVTGILLQASSAYSVIENTFQADTTPFAPYTTGILAYNTGSDDNQITDNTFTGVSVALNSNFINNGAHSGLQFLCNTDVSVAADIAILGDSTGDGGINPYQGTFYPYTTNPEPAGNVFGTSTLNIDDQQRPLTYNWQSAVADQDPVYITPAVTVDTISGVPECFVVTAYGAYPYGPSNVVVLPSRYNYGSFGGYSDPTDPAVKYAIASANVSYYMTNKNKHDREHLYYWANQMGTAYGDLLTANLLIEDSLIDSANKVYNNIVSKYRLDSAEANDFVQGRKLEDVLIDVKESGGNMLTLTTIEKATLQAVVDSSSMWAHTRAEGWLFAITGVPFADTLLYPVITDSMHDGGRKTSTHPQQAPAALINKVYPNPVHDILQVMYTAKSDESITIQIQDISGRTIITQPLQSGVPAGIDMSMLAPGMYLYRILEGTNMTMTGKIAKD